MDEFDELKGEPSFFAEFFLFLKERKVWWMAPLVLVFTALSLLVVFSEKSALAPFVYTLF